jgi:hypothetical protein
LIAQVVVNPTTQVGVRVENLWDRRNKWVKAGNDGIGQNIFKDFVYPSLFFLLTSVVFSGFLHL